MIHMLNCDCMEYMATLPDKSYQLAIVDPPYGIDIGGYGTIGGSGTITYATDYGIKKWDKNAPDKKYFEEVMRISKNQIIFGGNYFDLPLTNAWIVCDKKCQNGWDDDFSDGEMAWTSFENKMRIYRHLWVGALRKKDDTEKTRIHPTQKPVALYKWILKNYALPGDKIIDTHGGSGSICIACDDMGYDLDWMELDKDYYDAACKRYADYKLQPKLPMEGV